MARRGESAAIIAVIEADSPWKVGRPAIAAAVEEAADPADRVTDHSRRRNQIGHGEKRNLSNAAKDDHRQEAAKERAIERDSAVPNLEELRQQRPPVRIEEDKKDPRKEDAADQNPYGDIEHILRCYPLLGVTVRRGDRAPQADCEPEHEEHAIGMQGEAADVQKNGMHTLFYS